MYLEFNNFLFSYSVGIAFTVQYILDLLLKQVSDNFNEKSISAT